MVGRQVEERIEFDEDLRRQVLRKTNFRCASCGDKLDMVRHTIDHIIPISRGGTNEVDNLIGLCKMCNKYKTNLIYYPGDYYTYLTMTNVHAVSKIHKHVENYLKEEIKNLDLHRYPIISPCSTAMGALKGIAPKTYSRQLLFDIVYMQSTMRNAHSGLVKFLKDYAYYAIIKRTTQKMIAILRVDYSSGRNTNDEGKSVAQLTVYNEWETCNINLLAPIMQNLAEVTLSRYLNLNIPIDEVCIASSNQKIPNFIYNRYANNGYNMLPSEVSIKMYSGTLNDREELGQMDYVCIEVNR